MSRLPKDMPPGKMIDIKVAARRRGRGPSSQIWPTSLPRSTPESPRRVPSKMSRYAQAASPGRAAAEKGDSEATSTALNSFHDPSAPAEPPADCHQTSMGARLSRNSDHTGRALTASHPALVRRGTALCERLLIRSFTGRGSASFFSSSSYCNRTVFISRVRNSLSSPYRLFGGGLPSRGGDQQHLGIDVSRHFRGDARPPLLSCSIGRGCLFRRNLAPETSPAM